ncbi:MAG: glycosyltransferase family 1 protein [Candidatus Falkowbacteria bacterium]
MLIGIDASRANRSHKSGTEWYSYYLIRWLAKLDKENQYILYTDKPLVGGLIDLGTKQYINKEGGRDTDNEDEIKFDKNGYQIIKSPYNNFKAKVLEWPFSFLWTQLRFSLEMLFRAPDVLFVPAHTLPRIHPKKSVVTVHDIGFERERIIYNKENIISGNNIYRIIINLFVRVFTFGKYGANILDYHSWSVKFALKKAKKIITVSNFSKQEMVEIYGAKEEKIKVIYNGYNRHLYKKISAQEDEIKNVLNKYDIEGQFIFYLGRLEKKKNTPALIEAYAIMRQEHKDIKHKLVLVGDASHGYDEVKYAIKEFDLDSEIITTGWAPEVDVPYIYNGADVFVHPSRYEGFGITIIQAMACGTPVATSWVASIPEVAGDAALLFNPNDTKSIADAMAKIILDKDLKNDLINKGFKRAENFSWEKCARETLAELNKL